MNEYLFRLLFIFCFLNLAISSDLYSQSENEGSDAENNLSGNSENGALTTVKEEKMEIVLGMDQVKVLSFVPYGQVFISNEEVVTYDIFPSRKEIVFKGRKPDSQAMATIRDISGEIRMRINISVIRSDLSDKLEQIRAFIGDIEGLDIGIKGKNIYVGGEIVVPEDLGKITTILDLHQDVIQLFELSPRTQEVIGQKMQEEMRKAGIKDVTVRVVNRVFWLEGVVEKEDDKTRAINIASAFIPDRVQSLAAKSERIERPKRDAIQVFIEVTPKKEQPKPPAKMIKVTTQFVELLKSYSKIFGFKWSPSLATGGGTIQFGKTTNNGVTTKSDGTFSGTISNLFPQLAAAKSAGYARIVQSGMVIVKDGEKGRIFKKTSIPISAGTGISSGMIYVTPTFELNIIPSIVDKDKIEFGLGLNVTTSSTKDSSNTTNVIETKIIVGSKETAVLGGIYMNEGYTDYDKDPPNSDQKIDPDTGVPLFSFLKSKSYILSKTQFVVFVTAEIIDSATAATVEIKRKFRQRRQ